MGTTVNRKHFQCPNCHGDTVEMLCDARVLCQVYDFKPGEDGVLFSRKTDAVVVELTGGNPKYRCGTCGRTIDLRELPEMVIDFNQPKDPARPRKVEIKIDYASCDVGTCSLGTVIAPAGITDDHIERLFTEWRDLASDETADPEAEDEDEVCRSSYPDMDYEFLEWLVERRDFRHANGPGESLTLEC
jgi:hypothetical protein